MQHITTRARQAKTYRFLLIYLCCFMTFSLSAQVKDCVSFRFVFMSDVHLRGDDHIVQSYRRAIDKINKVDPDFVLSGGDQVFDVMRGQANSDSLFSLFVEESSKIKATLYPAMGNHDIFGIYAESPSDETHHHYKFNLFNTYFGDANYSFDHKGWHFVVLNPFEVENFKWIGSFSNETLDWLRHDFDSLDEHTPVVVVTHLPLVSVQDQILLPEEGPSIGPHLRHKRELMDILMSRNVKLVLQGHTHYPEDIMVGNRIRFITAGAIAGRPSWRGEIHGPRSFLHFEVKQSGEYTYQTVAYEQDES